MESRHVNCKGNSSDRPPRNVLKKCYSLPMLQRENDKLKHDLNLLQAAHDEKEVLLTESLLKVKLLHEKNQELKGLLEAAVPNEEKVAMKDASTCVIIDTKSVSTLTSIETQVEMKDAFTCGGAEAKNVSTSTSVLYVDKTTQVEMKGSALCAIETENVSTSSSVVVDVEIPGEDGARCKILLYDKIVSELPYDASIEIILFEKNLNDPKLSSNMKEHFQKIGGVNISKVVNNILSAIATKNLLKQFVWDATASNSFQNFKNILSCIYSVCSNENTQMVVNNIVKNALKNARAIKS